MTLDDLVRLEDALEAIGDHVDLDGYARMHNADAQADARRAYGEACTAISQHGSRRKALNFVAREIDKYR